MQGGTKRGRETTNIGDGGGGTVRVARRV